MSDFTKKLERENIELTPPTALIEKVKTNTFLWNKLIEVFQKNNRSHFRDVNEYTFFQNEVLEYLNRLFEFSNIQRTIFLPWLSTWYDVRIEEKVQQTREELDKQEQIIKAKKEEKRESWTKTHTKRFTETVRRVEENTDLAQSIMDCVDLDDIEECTDVYDIMQVIESLNDDNQMTDEEVIYYSTAIEYLKEHDSSLKESTGLAHDRGMTLENINSETLASILKTQNNIEEREELKESLESELEELGTVLFFNDSDEEED